MATTTMATDVDTAPDPTVYPFKDEQAVPDATYYYSSELEKLSIVIDNGSSRCKAGWSFDQDPRMVFRNIVAKKKNTPHKSASSNSTDEMLVGNDIATIDAVSRLHIRSAFDRNIVHNFETQEMILDYIFSHLGITTALSVDHPIVMTEAILNPNYCREHMSELLFECYSVPSVLYGIDSLFSLYQNHPNPEAADALIVSCGYHTTHVAPVLGGVFQARQCRRINVGGSHLDGFMQKILQLKYPGHMANITYSRAEEIMRDHTYVASDYVEETAKWVSDEFYFSHVHKLQLPYNQTSSSAMTAEQRQKRRILQLKKLNLLNVRRKEKKLEEEEKALDQLITIQKLHLSGHDELYKKKMKKMELESSEELQQAIDAAYSTIDDMKQKLAAAREKSETETVMSIKEQKQEKKCQDILQQLCGGDQRRGKDMAAWLEDLRRKKQELLESRALRKQRKADMAKRRTHASQQRMKIITELAQVGKRKREDTFGKNDEDWDVYKKISRDTGDSDSEAEQERLEEIDIVLNAYDPTVKDQSNQSLSAADLAEYHRLHVAIERFRAPEILFQPSIIGIDQCGIVETIDFVLKKFSPEEQDRMVQHIFLTGGCAKMPQFAERIAKDVMTIRPFQSSYNVVQAVCPLYDAWRGAKKMANSDMFADLSVTKQMYQDCGGEYLKEHCASNIYIPTPTTTDTTSSSTSAEPKPGASNT